MSVATVLTRGYGSFGSVNLLPTMGYGGSTSVAGPYVCKYGRVTSGRAVAGRITSGRGVGRVTSGRAVAGRIAGQS